MEYFFELVMGTGLIDLFSLKSSIHQNYGQACSGIHHVHPLYVSDTTLLTFQLWIDFFFFGHLPKSSYPLPLNLDLS